MGSAELQHATRLEYHLSRLDALRSRSPIHRDPDSARRPQWLVFDERFAHSYPSAERAGRDSQRVGTTRVPSRREPEKFGLAGSSSTGIPGPAVATQGPRLAAVVVFVSTGAYRAWLDTWKPNGLWERW